MNYFRYVAVTVFIAAVTSGCATRGPETFEPLPFDEAEYAALSKKGTGTVRGQVFATTAGGDVKKGAGRNVVMFPATRYGNLRYQEQVIGGKLLSRAEDARYKDYVLLKVTDGEGRFELLNVPPGHYYVLSDVTWIVMEPNKFGAIERTQGGKVVRKIEVKNEVTTDAILNF